MIDISELTLERKRDTDSTEAAEQRNWVGK
jgi:hypothetical protein